MLDTSTASSERQNDTAGEPSAPQDVDPDLMRTVARSRPQMNNTAPSTEQVDLVVDLGKLARAIVEHNRQVMAGEPADWSDLANLLDTAANACRRQVVIGK
jgi:hypothetical protein